MVFLQVLRSEVSLIALINHKRMFISCLVHFATLLAVVLPNVSSTSPLGHKTFLAIWVLSALVCLCLGGRWKYAALFLSGISGLYVPSLVFSTSYR